MPNSDGAQSHEQQADLLMQQPLDLSFAQLLRTLPRRAKEALAVCTSTAVLLGVAAVWQLSSAGGILGALTVGSTAYLVYLAGAKTAHIARWHSLRRQLKRRDPSIVDLVAFAVPSSVPGPNRARVALLPSIRLHDQADTAVHEAAERDQAPSWWARNRPENRALYFDGTRIRRTAPHTPTGVLLELVVDTPNLAGKLTPGTPVRVIGNDTNAVLLTNNSLIWPRGHWLIGG